MPIVQSGSINTTALLIPDAYIVIQPPAAQNLNGVPSNIAGIVGTASWGPVNSGVVVGNPSQYSAIFGPIQNRKYDAGTVLAVAALQGANNFVVVRVTDGTDAAANAVVLTNCITFSSKYTGSLGNQTLVTVSPGSQIGTYKVVVGIPGLLPESFDNIGLGLSGSALWAAIANAINNGTTAFRGPSALISATAGSGTTVPAAATYTLSGGSDGATTINGSVLLGVDVAPRSGMYALRGKKCAAAVLADCDDISTATTQISFGAFEGVYMLGTTPAGDTIANASVAKANAGIDSPWYKHILGDWVSWLDSYNNITRFVSPQGVALGLATSLTPNQSLLNKKIQGIAGTQSSTNNQGYVSADFQQMASAGIDVITNPSPGGAYFSFRFGHNSGSNPLTHGDNYTRMTDYIGATLNAGMGVFVGMNQAANAIGNAGTPSAQAEDTLGTYFDNLQDQGLIGSPGGPPAYSIKIDPTNNPQSRVALGYLQADCSVQYQSVIEYFIVNVQGGQSVQITRTNVVPT